MRQVVFTLLPPDHPDCVKDWPETWIAAREEPGYDWEPTGHGPDKATAESNLFDAEQDFYA